jgi:hypothetical protein
MAGADSNGKRRGEPQGSRRSRQGVRRPHRVEFALTDEEFAVLGDAAVRRGLARGAFAAEAAMAVASGEATVADSGLRDALSELIRAAGHIRRVGVNLNQAVARLHATGQRSADLLPYARECLRRAARVDAAAEAVRKALSAAPRRIQPIPEQAADSADPHGARNDTESAR